MRPLIIGILIFLAWLALSTWYYATRTFPAFSGEDVSETEQVVPDSLSVQAPETTEPAEPDPPGDVVVYFNYNKTNILNEELLHNFITEGEPYLEAVSGACVQLTGHTCDIGTKVYNMDLGKRRAESVQKFLISNGLDDRCIQVESRGEEEPAVPNTGESNREKNRRVVVRMK